MLLWGKFRCGGLVHQPADYSADWFYRLRREQIWLEWAVQHLCQPIRLLGPRHEEEHIGGAFNTVIPSLSWDGNPILIMGW